jgi:hypothetical protein
MFQLDGQRARQPWVGGLIEPETKGHRLDTVAPPCDVVDMLIVPFIRPLMSSL